MSYYVELMRVADIPEVSAVEKLCFPNPWPQAAYRRELRKPGNNYYIVLRERRQTRVQRRSDSDQGSRNRFRLLPFMRHEDEQASVDAIVGFAGMWLMFDEAHITTIGVHPEKRGEGLGELLIVHLFVEAMSRGAELLTLEVRVSNDAAQALYKKYGFTQQGIRRRYYSDNGEDAHIMWSPRVREPEYAAKFNALRDELQVRLGQEIETVPEPDLEARQGNA